MSQRLIEVVHQDGRSAHLILTSAIIKNPVERGYMVTIHGLDGIPIAGAEWPIALGTSIEAAEHQAEKWAHAKGWRRKKPMAV